MATKQETGKTVKESGEDKVIADNLKLRYKNLQEDIDKTLNDSKKESEENKKLANTCRLLSMILKQEVEGTSTDSKKKTAENKKLTNIFRILYMLLKQEKGGIDHLATNLGCSVPAVKKYIKDIKNSLEALHVIEDMRFSIKFDKEEGCYKLSSDTKLLALSRQEMELLYETVRCISRQVNAPFKDINKLEKKIYNTLEKEIRENLSKSVEVSGPKIERNLSVSLDMINEAINERNKLVIHYIPSSYKDQVIREIVPFSLMVHDYEWYIRAFCLESKTLKTFTINQIVRMEIKKLSKREEKLLPEDIDVTSEHIWDWKEKEQKEVKIKFTGLLAERMKKKLQYRTEHPSQKISSFGKDLILSFKVTNPGNMIPWILQFRSSAEVIEPESLREKMKKTLNSMKALY